MSTIAVVTPVYNDWASFAELLLALDGTAARMGATMRVIAVDDGSLETFDPETVSTGTFRHIESVEIVRLAFNAGHQRAIAVGLVVAAEDARLDGVVVMDSDGEDRPEDVPHLIKAADQNCVVVARRTHRSEGLAFRTFYAAYKLLFRVLTGARIDFGNFCFVPRRHLVSLTYNANIWNHLAAALTRSRIPVRRVETSRGTRFAGNSKMNFLALVLHGLSAVAVYSDAALVRIVISALLLAAATAIALAAVVAVRLGTDWAIPGWATNLFAALSILFVQSVMFGLVSVFTLLNGRTGVSFIAATDAPRCILERRLRRLK